MRLLALASLGIFLVLPTIASGQEIKLMTIGRNAQAFHKNLFGKTFVTQDAFEDHWWRFMDVLNAMYRPIHKRTGKKFNYPGVRAVENLNNAVALIHNGERFVLVDPGFWNRDQTGMLGEMITYGHEVGHHVCGHTAGLSNGTSRENELEADRFSGAALRALYEDTEISDYRSIYEEFTLEAVTRAAWAVYGSMAESSSHPGAQQRVAAIVEGYSHGSSCLERGVLDVPHGGLASPPSAAISQGTMWLHNGSLMTLKASGGQRQFYYHTPRAGVPVTPGTLLFEGIRSGNTYSGRAYIFSSICGPTAYQVTGIVAADQRSVTMHGKAPRLDARCQTIGNRDDVLVFSLQEN